MIYTICTFYFNNQLKVFNETIYKNIRKKSTNKQTISKSITLNPWWVTGFADAEGSFCMSILKSKTRLNRLNYWALF